MAIQNKDIVDLVAMTLKDLPKKAIDSFSLQPGHGSTMNQLAMSKTLDIITAMADDYCRNWGTGWHNMVTASLSQHYAIELHLEFSDSSSSFRVKRVCPIPPNFGPSNLKAVFVILGDMKKEVEEHMSNQKHFAVGKKTDAAIGELTYATQEIEEYLARAQAYLAGLEVIHKGLSQEKGKTIAVDSNYTGGLIEMTRKFMKALCSAQRVMEKFKHMNPDENAREIFERSIRMMEGKYGTGGAGPFTTPDQAINAAKKAHRTNVVYTTTGGTSPF